MRRAFRREISRVRIWLIFFFSFAPAIYLDLQLASRSISIGLRELCKINILSFSFLTFLAFFNWIYSVLCCCCWTAGNWDFWRWRLGVYRINIREKAKKEDFLFSGSTQSLLKWKIMCLLWSLSRFPQLNINLSFVRNYFWQLFFELWIYCITNWPIIWAYWLETKITENSPRSRTCSALVAEICEFESRNVHSFSAELPFE